MTRIALVALALAAAASPKASQNFRCSIAAASGGGVHVAIESTSSKPIAGDVHVAFTLTPAGPTAAQGVEMGYWAPVDLESGKPYGPNQPRHLTLPPRGVIKKVLVPAKLSWARRISSIWPNRKLAEVVPAGRYTLHLEIEGPPKARKTRSNGLAVVVDARGLGILANLP